MEIDLKSGFGSSEPETLPAKLGDHEHSLNCNNKHIVSDHNFNPIFKVEQSLTYKKL